MKATLTKNLIFLGWLRMADGQVKGLFQCLECSTIDLVSDGGSRRHTHLETSERNKEEYEV